MRPSLRDDGDGSSSSTNADEPMPSIRQFERQIPVRIHNNIIFLFVFSKNDFYIHVGIKYSTDIK